MDLFDYHQLYLTTPRTNQSIWAVTWSSFISSPVLVRITFGTDWSSLNYKIEHWIVTPSTFELRELVAASTNYDFLVPCTQPGCLSSSPIQDFFSSSICASMEHSPLMALRIFDIHSINRRPGIYYSKIKSQTIFNSFMAYLIGNSPVQPGISTRILADCPTDFLTVNSNLNTTISSMSHALRTYSSLSFYTDGSLVNAASTEARMGAAFILTEPVALNLQLAVSTTTWPSAYKAELLAVLLALLVAPNNCSVNLYSDCESIIKHFDYINNGGFINIRNIFKQPHHNLWLTILQEIKKKNLTVVWHKVVSHSNDLQNNAVDRLACTSAYNHVSAVNSDIGYNSNLYLPWWNSRLINTHYRHFIRSLTYLQGLDAWKSLGRFSDYPQDEIDWELTGSLLQPMDSGTSLLASRHKRNLLALMLEELPTLSKMQLHKPHVYDKDWICCHCELDSEDFNHLWLCSKSLIDLQNIIPQAKILLQDTINLFTTSGTSNMSFFFDNNPLWILLRLISHTSILFFLHRSDQRNNPILFNRCFKATRPLSKPSLLDNSNSFGICPDILLERNLDPTLC